MHLPDRYIPYTYSCLLCNSSYFDCDRSHVIFFFLLPAFPVLHWLHVIASTRIKLYGLLKKRGNAERVSIIQSCWMDVPLGKPKKIASFQVMSWGKLKSLTFCIFHTGLQDLSLPIHGSCNA